MTYPKAYNRWAGNPHGTAPDFTRCCESVTPNERGGFAHQHQCTRKRGFGPDQAYCKQHDPEARKAREEASRQKYAAETNRRRYEWHGRSFYDVLKQIAEGHNDPGTLARETLDKFHAGESK